MSCCCFCCCCCCPYRIYKQFVMLLVYSEQSTWNLGLSCDRGWSLNCDCAVTAIINCDCVGFDAFKHLIYVFDPAEISCLFIYLFINYVIVLCQLYTASGQFHDNKAIIECEILYSLPVWTEEDYENPLEIVLISLFIFYSIMISGSALVVTWHRA